MMILRSCLQSNAPWVLLVGALGAGACGGTEPTSKPATSADPKAVAGVDEKIIHEKCDSSMGKVETVDANNDAKPDITLVVDKGGRNLCRITDLNHDGKPEMVEYWDDAGNLRRRELSFENTEAVTAIELYKGGKLSLRTLDTTGQRRIDTWDYYDDTGRRIKRERDTSNAGHIDQWWTFNVDGTVTIAVDRRGDGQPDPESTITVTAGGAAVTADAGPAPAPGASASNSDAGNVPPSAAPPVIYSDGQQVLGDAGTPAKKKKKGNK